jgi:hypothetical protein
MHILRSTMTMSSRCSVLLTALVFCLACAADDASEPAAPTTCPTVTQQCVAGAVRDISIMLAHARSNTRWGSACVRQRPAVPFYDSPSPLTTCSNEDNEYDAVTTLMNGFVERCVGGKATPAFRVGRGS